MSRYLAYRNAPRLAAYLAPPVDDVVTRLRPILGPVPSRDSLPVRFWSKVDTSAGVFACWTWTAKRNFKGYGEISVGGRDVKAHRVAWELTNGPIPEGLLVLHHCDNPACVNPGHLHLGTVGDNTREMHQRKRARGQQRGGPVATHCLRGHEFRRGPNRNYCPLCRQFQATRRRPPRAAVLVSIDPPVVDGRQRMASEAKRAAGCARLPRRA